ncbi:MAG: ATP-dependent zinc protease [Deltaproteobacteria bacterium]|jgi:hypothetical protein|nr:ATP-dependent zinc protease [Deltaproteobacteria bacterium]
MKIFSWATKVFFILLLLCHPPGFAEDAPPIKNLQVAGWVENVSIFPGNMKIKAKLDTGARNSSLNARNLEEFYRDGDKWVRFKLKNWKGRTENFEARIIRTATIKQHETDSVTRPVIHLGICLGNVYKEVEVNLQDRGKFNYQMLIGRSYLKNSFLVDASTTFTTEPSCQGSIDQ